MKIPQRVLVGAAVFLVHTIFRVADLRQGVWGEALLLLAALVIVPLLFDLLEDSADDALGFKLLHAARWLQFGAALGLVVSYELSPGYLTAVAGLPWASVLLLLAATGGRRLMRRGFHPVALLCRDTGMLYAAVGAVWLLADRLGIRPLNFDSSIVLLTAVHFHYAGLVLPVLTGCALDALPRTRGLNVIGGAAVAGVPAVAIGITATQLRWDFRIELAATSLMASAGLAVGWLHLRMAARAGGPASARVLLGFAGLALGAGMVLALLYGTRYFFHPFPWLDLPWMRALHGSLNALGFGLCGILGWRIRRRFFEISHRDEDRLEKRH